MDTVATDHYQKVVPINYRHCLWVSVESYSSCWVTVTV